MRPKSFYDLRFTVPPGSARKDAHHICGTLPEAISALDDELSDSINVWLLFAYGGGADLFLDVYQHGALARSIDLHPLITLEVAGFPAIRFLGSGDPVGYEVGADDPSTVRMALSDGLFWREFDDRFSVTVEWAGVEVPALVGDVAGEGDYVFLGKGAPGDLSGLGDLDEDELEDALIDRGWIEYGFHDFEE